MPTNNRDIRHNFNWHARPANEVIEIIDGVECIHTPWVVGERIVYDAYGQHPWSPDEPSAADVFGEELPFLWQGLTTDPAAKLFDNMPRAFDQTTEPFMEQEPPAYVDGLNEYTALNDNPIHEANPLGE